MTIVLIISLLVLGIPSSMPVTARAVWIDHEHDNIINEQIKRFTVAGNGSKLRCNDILCALNDIDDAPSTKITLWSRNDGDDDDPIMIDDEHKDNGNQESDAIDNSLDHASDVTLEQMLDYISDTNALSLREKAIWRAGIE